MNGFAAEMKGIYKQSGFQLYQAPLNSHCVDIMILQDK